MGRVQFNLLPDVKLKHIETQRSKNLVISISLLVSGIALGIFILLLLSVQVVQKKQLSDAQKKATSLNQQVQSVPNLNKVITVQNQLTTLSTLHQGKHVSSRIFRYFPQMTPSGVNITSLAVDFVGNTMTISGTADSHKTVNSFISTMKATSYKIGSQDSNHTAFPSVVESSFSVTPHSSTFVINATFDPILFANNLPSTPLLQVPRLSSTRANENTLFNQTGGQ